MLSLIDDFKPWIVASLSQKITIAIALNTILLGIAAVTPKKLLTPAGYLHAWFLGVLIWGTLGWQGYVVVMFYFLIGSFVTKIGMAQKEAEGIAEKRSGMRGPENVWGSALIGGLCAVGAGIFSSNIFSPSSSLSSLSSLFIIGYVASFSTKLSDTCASEVGKAYGQRTFLITTLQPVPRGTEGAVSLEGTLAGLVASAAQALVGFGVGLIGGLDIAWCILAAFIATNIESVIGATLQSKYDWLTNELVNVLNTLIGAIAAMLLAFSWVNLSS
ncbi:TIGR00297 family protein [Calothrix sp. UHCC 0171]|uniref:TIGR00297 family protein n=1 Tax=Calothrix sp. UHCC 0171 TaxID=3110245 RepID=UPI002B2164FC|nr:TIGR00297 family protein [Calothrix sp. UHCC 0171]MEA5572097.1 TIGR00297 family protein [Calothrix sp. UHCC 0171]